MPRTLSQVEIDNIRANCGGYEEAESLRRQLMSEPDDRLLDAADSWLIDFVPDPGAKRALLVHEGLVSYGCPVHRGGRYVFTKSADPFVPFRLTCTMGGEHYPNEELPESGSLDSPWEEQGWLDTRKRMDGEPNRTDGLRYHFNAHYVYWGRCTNWPLPICWPRKATHSRKEWPMLPRYFCCG